MKEILAVRGREFEQVGCKVTRHVRPFHRKISVGDHGVRSGDACFRLSDSGGEQKVLERAKKNEGGGGEEPSLFPAPAPSSPTHSVFLRSLFRSSPLSEGKGQASFVLTFVPVGTNHTEIS